jgi:hypothetical protein
MRPTLEDGDEVMRTPRRSLPALFAAAALVAGCQPSTAPDAPLDFDSYATVSGYEALDSLFASPAFAGFRALEGRTPLGGPAGAPVISAGHRGVTFVYDPETDQYTPDPEREGAPPTGVRFVLYEVDLSGTPIVDEEIGHADLVDGGDGSAEDVVLDLTAVAYETTILEYRIALDVTQGGGTLRVTGALQDLDGLVLDFDIEATSATVGDGKMLDVAFDLRVDARDFSIVGNVSGMEEGGEGEGDVELTVRHGDDSVRVSASGSGGQIDGSVFVDGALFATVTGDAEDPVIASATGEPLTFLQLLALRRIVDGVEDVFDFLEDLLDPVDELIILAIIL